MLISQVGAFSLRFLVGMFTNSSIRSNSNAGPCLSLLVLTPDPVHSLSPELALVYFTVPEKTYPDLGDLIDSLCAKTRILPLNGIQLGFLLPRSRVNAIGPNNSFGSDGYLKLPSRIWRMVLRVALFVRIISEPKSPTSAFA